jgi:hypothetical protein
MNNRAQEVDVVDVHVTSESQRVDSFSQYDLLDGTKKYTVELTEFVSPLAGHESLPPISWFSNAQNIAAGLTNLIEIRRKRTTGIAHGHINTTLPVGGDFVFTEAHRIFKKDERRRLPHVGALAYQLQRYFDDIKSKYIFRGTAAQEFALQTQITIIRARNTIIADVNSSPEEVAQATAEKAAANNVIGNMATAAERIHFNGDLYGGTATPETSGNTFLVTADDFFVSVSTTPDGTLRIFFSKWFTDNFFLVINSYGQLLFGLDGIIAFRSDGAVIHTGLAAISNGAVLLLGGTNETVELYGKYTCERHFEHRVRIEVESQMPIPPTTSWSTKNTQTISHSIATFPIVREIQTGIVMNSEGVTTGSMTYRSSLLTGDIVWRRAEDKVSERYLILNSQFFHNVRLELHIVRKLFDYPTSGFKFVKEKMVFSPGEAWTAKLRFRSV